MRYVILVCCFAFGALLPAADVLIMEEIVAKINGDIITSADLAQDRQDIEKELRRRGLIGQELSKAVEDQLANQLRNRIDMLLLTQKAKEMDMKVDPEVNRQVADMMRQVNVADPDEFQALVVKETGRPYADYRQQLQDQAMVQAVVREEIMRKISVTSEEIRAYYDEHREDLRRQEQVILREILVSTEGKTDPAELAAAEKKAQDLAARAKRGEAFPQMAQNNSDSNSKNDGGILPPYKKGELNPDLEALVWDKDRGYVTDAVRVASGWLILKVEDHPREGIPEFAEVENMIQNQLYASRQDPALRAYLTKLRSQSFLQIKEGYTDSGAAPEVDTTWREPGQLRPEIVTKEDVIANPSMKRLLGVFPIPGTEKTGVSSSR
jgi:peptidyl-prolyl cis-trans isomerase SurA